MLEKQIIEQTAKYVQQVLNNDSSHDWWHAYRVWKIAAFIAGREQLKEVKAIQDCVKY